MRWREPFIFISLEATSWDKSGPSFMVVEFGCPSCRKPAKRADKINGEAVAIVDYPASVPNIIYQHLTGKGCIQMIPTRLKV